MKQVIKVAVLLLAACAQKSGARSPAVPAVSESTLPDVAAVSALMPVELRGRIEFAKRVFTTEGNDEKTTYTLVAPTGWEQVSKAYVQLRPDEKGGNLSFLDIGPNCDGPCTPKDWEAVADRVNFKFPQWEVTRVLKDNKQKGRRTMIVELRLGGLTMTKVIVAWWTDGAPNYHCCVASLDEEVKDAAPAFEKACSSIHVEGNR